MREQSGDAGTAVATPMAAPRSARLRRVWLALGRPHMAFALLALAFGTALLVVTPPLLVPDEPYHFFRSYHIATGQFMAQQQGDLDGGWIPKSIHTVAVMLQSDIPMHPERKFALAMLRDASVLPLAAEQQFFMDFSTIALYTPVPYTPQALAIAIGRQLGAGPLALVFLGRAAALIVALVITALAIRLMPIGKWFLVVYGMLPGALFVRSSMSADVLANALAVLLVALALRYALDPEACWGAGAKIAVLVVCVLLALSKQSYFLLPCVVLLIPPRRFGSLPRYLGYGALALGLGLVAVGYWTLAARLTHTSAATMHLDASSTPHVVFDPAAQAAQVLAEPWRFGRVVADTVRVDWVRYGEQFVGILGTLDAPLPPWLLLAWAVVLPIVALLDGAPNVGFAPWQRALMLATGSVSMVLVMLIAYLMWNRVGAGMVLGVQGRYFIPIAPLLLLPLCNARLRLPPVGRALVVGFCVLSSCMVLAVLLERYYGV